VGEKREKVTVKGKTRKFKNDAMLDNLNLKESVNKNLSLQRKDDTKKVSVIN
jgi:hypothetical protein